MIDENPFQVANKSGTLELIKLKMRDRVGTESSTEAFDDILESPLPEPEGVCPGTAVF
jgi:hypothetical protein